MCMKTEAKQKRAPHIQVRPRRGSTLEAIQRDLNNDMADTLHGWAEQFGAMVKASETEEVQ